MSRSAIGARFAAILIAIAAFVDPSIPISRAVPPIVAVLGDSTARAGIERQIDHDYVVVHGPLSSAAATVIAGRSLPGDIAISAGPVFATSTTPRVWIDTIIAPSTLSVESRGELLVVVGTTDETPVEASVASRGVRLATEQPRATSDRARISLPYQPLTTGPVLLDVTVRAGGDSARSSIVVDGEDQRWPVLFYDPRPSWMSTFVRRSIEGDRRFVVGGRVNTSRSIATTLANSPRTLADPSLLELYDVIAVGAPDQLTDADVSGLETFLHRRAGSVILLFDEPPATTRPVSRLLTVTRWSSDARQEPIAINSGGDTSVLRAAELSSPANSPANASTIAIAGSLPVVWSMPVGAGQLIVNGALDSWKYRDAASSSFDALWRSTFAGAAARSLPPVLLSLSNRAVAPYSRVQLSVIVRDAVLAGGNGNATADATATLDDSVPIRLWPAEPGRFSGRFRAPALTGTHRVAVTANGNREQIEFVVGSDVRQAAPDESELVRAWTSATGGRVVEPTRLRAALDAALPRDERAEMLQPMRSPWWILPFALLLAFEWWWRRRNGNS